jgi:hypothetical protein
MIPLKPIRGLLRLGLVAIALLAGRGPETTAGDEEFLGPFPGWKDAKKDFGAVGDGKADDTAALQAALSSLLDANGSAVALYLPRGTYRITGTLKLPRKGGREAIGLNIQGQDPDRTIIRWGGPAKGVMFEWNAWYSRLGRITFDGAGKADAAITQSNDFVTANEMADLVFRNLGFGIRAGLNKGVGIAETAVLRCRFIRCSEAGFSSEDFNTLDWWFRWCTFQNCRRGLTNAVGSGNFHCYECVFQRSTEADITINNTGYFSFRHNRSTGSRAFFVAGASGAGCQLTFQGNTIVNTVDATAIRVGNVGPVLLLDNTILSRARAVGPAVAGERSAAVSAGNRFSVSQPLRFANGVRSIDDRVIRRTTSSPAEPKLPVTPARSTAKVFEVAAGADGAAVQAAIDAAVSSKTARPIVHLAAAVIPVRKTITVPTGCDIRLVGEGIPYVTRLEWAGEGEGPILRVEGPSRAEIGDFALIGGDKAVGLVIGGIDQAGSRVLFDQAQATGAKACGWRIEGVKKASVALCDIGHSDCGVGMRVAGGPGPVVILSGASSSNDLSYEIADGARLLARDIWYETGSKPRFLRFTGSLSGDFTLHGAKVAHPRQAGEPGLEIDGFRGRVSLLGVQFTEVGDKGTSALAVRGETARVALIGCHGTGDYLPADSPAVRLASIRATPDGGGEPVADANANKASDDYLRDMLAQAREPHRLLGFRTPPTGTSDLRIHRVFVRGGRDGIVVKGGK